ncbi:MAG: CRISPR-associated endonuclease Cas2 [Candidatus Uhrbacteria bacterium]|nr:CRISPR-associated endonuclease Cas2 [Candidatus Uhrbacteria bacterium]
MKRKPMIQDVFELLLEAGGEMLFAWLERGYMVHRGRAFKFSGDEQRSQLATLRKLKRERYISLEAADTGCIVKLTERGRLMAIFEMLGKITNELPQEKYCYVIFDIPEKQRSFRRNFTKLLRHAGFERLQKSVWRSRRDVVRGMRLLLKMNPGIEKYIRVIVGNE